MTSLVHVNNVLLLQDVLKTSLVQEAHGESIKTFHYLSDFVGVNSVLTSKISFDSPSTHPENKLLDGRGR
jgi:hypothetical protein